MQRGSLLWRAAALAWIVLIFALSSRSDLPGPELFPEWLPIDKAGHFVTFGVLGALFYLSGLKPVLALAATGLYGFADEIHQLFVPGRDADVVDWLADLAGGAACIWLLVRLEAHYDPSPDDPRGSR